MNFDTGLKYILILVVFSGISPLVIFPIFEATLEHEVIEVPCYDEHRNEINELTCTDIQTVWDTFSTLIFGSIIFVIDIIACLIFSIKRKEVYYVKKRRR